MRIFLIVVSIIFFVNNISKASEIKIAYVDIDKILYESKAGKEAKKNIEDLFNKNRDNSLKIEKKLIEEEKSILQQKNILSKDEIQKKVVELNKKITNFKNKVRENKIVLNKKRAITSKKILEILNPALSDYATKNSISVILQKKFIVIGKSELDITDDIMKVVNNKIKKINLN